MKILLIFYKPQNPGIEPKSSMQILDSEGDYHIGLLYSQILNRENKTPQDVLHVTVIDPGDKTIPEFYLPCLSYDAKSKSVKWDSAKMIELNFAYWIPQRRELLADLDIQFLRALEKSDEKEKRIVTANKGFLRDLPNFVLTKWAETLKIVKSDGSYKGVSQNDSRFAQKNGQIFYEGKPVGVVDSFDSFTASQQTYYTAIFNHRYSRVDVLKFTPFHNILFIDVLSEGSGYTDPPTIKFECDYDGAMHPRYECRLRDDKLAEVVVITPGCGYIEEPKLVVSEPNLPNGKPAIVSAKIYNKVIQEYPSFSNEELKQRLPKDILY